MAYQDFGRNRCCTKQACALPLRVGICICSFDELGFYTQFVLHFAGLFPLLSIIYMVLPHSRIGKFMKHPFVKFICHSSSYLLFLRETTAHSVQLCLRWKHKHEWRKGHLLALFAQIESNRVYFVILLLYWHGKFIHGGEWIYLFSWM